MANVKGTTDSDVLDGTTGSDVIYAYGGNDQIDGLGGLDTVYGGGGNDLIAVDFGATAYGGGGLDMVFINARNEGAGVTLSNTDPTADFGDFEMISGDLSDFDDVVRLSVASEDQLGYLDGWGGTDRLTVDFSAATAGLNLGGASGFEVVKIIGSDHDDRFDLIGEGGTLTGGAGDDRLSDHSTGGTLINGGDGNDVIYGFGDATNRYFGGAGDDTVWGVTALDMEAQGGAGHDVLHLDLIDGAQGVTIGAGGDFAGFEVFAGTLTSHNDVVTMEVPRALTHDPFEPTALDAGAGDDLLVLNLAKAGAMGVAGVVLEEGLLSLTFENGDTLTYWLENFERVQVTGSDLADSLSGLIGQDTIDGRGGDDSLFGGGGGFSTLSGGAGDDQLSVGAVGAPGGYNLLQGNAGNDSLYLAGNANLAYGGGGDDDLQGGGEGSELHGDAGSDSLYSNGHLFGGSGDDRLEAAGGATALEGGAGRDTLWASDGADQFVFAGDTQSHRDVLYGYDFADDAVFISGGVAFEDLVFTVKGTDLLVEWDMGSLFIVDGATTDIRFFTDGPAFATAASPAMADSLL